MTGNVPPQILVCAQEVTDLAELRRLLAGGGHAVGGHLLGMPDPPDVDGYQLVVVEGSAGRPLALDLCRRLRGRLGEAFVGEAIMDRVFAKGRKIGGVLPLPLNAEDHNNIGPADRVCDVRTNFQVLFNQITKIAGHQSSGPCNAHLCPELC